MNELRINNVDICDEFGWERLEETFGSGITHTYGSLLFALQYCLPLFVLFITYASIGIKMWNRQIPGDGRFNGGFTKQRYKPVQKMVRMVLLVSALYAFCWLPQNLLMNILIPWNSDLTSHPYILYYWWIAHTIAMSHSIVNAFIYYDRNARFREGFRFFLRFLPFIKTETFEVWVNCGTH
ncbi:unnamed protein product [Enterobius vermicularis]|uniref:G_PROTEIN_RECEP_F1_2 domain-containing protein n=1 Tax=Enterobius vermicularis TaxID=51028 RepID=A0A0N4VL49_ENTVE|nr:unnamed protein product [Enterobius vermicularis]